MNMVLQPWQLLLAILSSWFNQRQQDMIAFQNAEINALMQQLGRKRLRLTDDQRRLLAVNAKAIGRKALLELTTIVTPDTLLRWHRELVAKKLGSHREAEDSWPAPDSPSHRRPDPAIRP